MSNASKIKNVQCGCGESAPTCDGYTSTPTHLRIWNEDGDWLLDAADDAGHYTEFIFDGLASFGEALAEVPGFISHLAECGITLTQRPRKAM